MHSQNSRQNYQAESQNNNGLLAKYYKMNQKSVGTASDNISNLRSHYDGLLGKYYKMNQKSAGTASKNVSNPHSIQKLGISAWGIIAIILSIIVFSTIAYYVFILYPFICRKDQTYDITELIEVNSVCTVSDNANNMPLYRSSNDISNDVSLNR